MAGPTYRVREFARLAGVTVRALHHYDRLGLLRPERTASGYRVYSAKDLEVLEQIVALKFIGLPLNRIKQLLRTNRNDVAASLRAQRTLLEEKRTLLERAIAAVRETEQALQVGHDVNGDLFKRIIEVIEMQNNDEDWNRKYQALVQGKIERLKAMTPEARMQLREQWTALFTDIARVLDQDPASATVQQLADRWVQLLGTFSSQGMSPAPETLKQFGAAYPAGAEWPAGTRQPDGPMADKRIWEFMARALAVRG